MIPPAIPLGGVSSQIKQMGSRTPFIRLEVIVFVPPFLPSIICRNTDQATDFTILYLLLLYTMTTLRIPQYQIFEHMKAVKNEKEIKHERNVTE